MNVKEVLKTACDFIGLEDIKNVIDDSSSMTEEQTAIVNKLLKCFNLVQEEISTEFLSLTHKEEISASDRINFFSLTKKVLKILNIKRGNKNLPFKIFTDHVVFNGSATEITYNYIPEEVGLNDDILYLVPVRIYAYGVAREFFIFEGLTDKASMFENRFKNSINSLIKKDKNIVLPNRIWF